MFLTFVSKPLKHSQLFIRTEHPFNCTTATAVREGVRGGVWWRKGGGGGPRQGMCTQGRTPYTGVHVVRWVRDHRGDSAASTARQPEANTATA